MHSKRNVRPSACTSNVMATTLIAINDYSLSVKTNLAPTYQIPQNDRKANEVDNRTIALVWHLNTRCLLFFNDNDELLGPLALEPPLGHQYDSSRLH